MFGSLSIIHMTKNVHVHMCVHVHLYMHIWTKYIHMCINMKFSYVCIWTHLLCLCQQIYLGTCVYVNVDMYIKIACVHSYAPMWVSKAVCVHIPVYICIHLSHAHMYIYASIHVCFNMSKSSHIHMLKYKYKHG